MITESCQNLYNSINKRIEISEEEFQDIQQYFKPSLIKKGEHFVLTGESVPFLAYVNTGVLYSYSTDDKGEKHVVQIALHNHWISDPYGFLSQDVAIYNVAAIEHSELLLMSHDNFEKICETNLKFERYFRLIIQNAYIQSLQRISGIYSESAEERYLKLMESSPEMMQKVPQHYIASFLGIKPQSLSRIRKSLSGH